MANDAPPHASSRTEGGEATKVMTDNPADEKPAKVAGVVDYTGAAAKSDPAEIKLVRKLDFRIMVSQRKPWRNCALWTPTTYISAADPLDHVLS